MTDTDKVRIVAKWCGWKQSSEEPYYWHRPDGKIDELPDYLNSRDACAEFERVVKGLGWVCTGRYGDSLRSIVVEGWGKPLLKGDITFLMATATPAQRLDAILAVIEETRDGCL